MNELHNNPISVNTFVPKEGQHGLLCSNNKSLRCPSLSLDFIPSHEAVEKVYDYLFELIRNNRATYDSNTNNSNLCSSFDIESGGSKDDTGPDSRT
jgi:hypothetical protein